MKFTTTDESDSKQSNTDSAFSGFCVWVKRTGKIRRILQCRQELLLKLVPSDKTDTLTCSQNRLWIHHETAERNLKLAKRGSFFIFAALSMIEQQRKCLKFYTGLQLLTTDHLFCFHQSDTMCSYSSHISNLPSLLLYDASGLFQA